MCIFATVILFSDVCVRVFCHKTSFVNIILVSPSMLSKKMARFKLKHLQRALKINMKYKCCAAAETERIGIFQMLPNVISFYGPFFPSFFCFYFSLSRHACVFPSTEIILNKKCMRRRNAHFPFSRQFACWKMSRRHENETHVDICYVLTMRFCSFAVQTKIKSQAARQLSLLILSNRCKFDDGSSSLILATNEQNEKECEKANATMNTFDGTQPSNS